MVAFVQALLSLVIGCIFLASSAPKLVHPRGFVLAVLDYRVLPSALGWLFGWMLPPLECFLALLLIGGVNSGIVGCALSLVLLSFMLAVGINLRRGRDGACHCFGEAPQHKIGWRVLVRDGALLAATIVASLGSPWLGLAPWSLFHLVGFQEARYGIPALLCLGGALGATVVLRSSLFEKRRQRHRRSGLAV